MHCRYSMTASPHTTSCGKIGVMQGFLSRRDRSCADCPQTFAAGERGGRGEPGEGDSTARSEGQELGATRAAAWPTGAAYCARLRGHEVRPPEIAADLNRGSLGDVWWASFGEQERVSSGERQGNYVPGKLLGQPELTQMPSVVQRKGWRQDDGAAFSPAVASAASQGVLLQVPILLTAPPTLEPANLFFPLTDTAPTR